MSGNTAKPTTTARGGESQAGASRRAILGAAAVLPLAALPAMPNDATLPEGDATLLRLGRALAAVEAKQDALEAAAEVLPIGSAGREAGWRKIWALSADWHRLIDQITDTPARTEAGRQMKARILLRQVDPGNECSPNVDDRIAWSLARDVLGIAEGVARAEDAA